MVHVQTKSYEVVDDIVNTCKYGVNIPEWSAVIFAIRTGACRMFNHTSPTIQEFRPINKQHFNLTCPLTSPYPTQKKTLKQHDLSHLTEKSNKNRSNINLAVKVFTHPHSSFPNSYIFSQPGLKLHGLIDEKLPWKFQPTFQSWTTSDSFGPKSFPQGPPWLLKLSRHSLSFATPESSTPPPARGRRFLSKMSKRIPTRGW